jgi:hypothetical protein
MKINKLILLPALFLVASCQSSASSQRSISAVGFVPMSGTATESGYDPGEYDFDRSGVAVRLENRDGVVGLGVEVRQSDYTDPSYPSEGLDGIELAGFFRRYMDNSDNSLYIEASPILGLGVDDGSGAESSSYALLRVAAGYRWAMAENIFIDADTGYYRTFMPIEFANELISSSTEIDGVDVGLAIGFNF